MKRFFLLIISLLLFLQGAQAEFRVFSVYHAESAALPPYAEAPVLEKAPFAADSELLTVELININVGDAIFLSCGGQTMLVDGGTESKLPVLQAFFQSRGIKRLTYYFNTHSHDDHIQASTALVESGFPADAYLAKHNSDAQVPAITRLMTALRNQGLPYQRVKSMDSVNLGGAKLTFFQNDRVEAGHGINARSMMLHVQFKGSTLLLTADVTGYSLSQVMEDYPQFMDVDIIKSPHHGIDRLRPEFIDAVSPELFVITGPNESGTRLSDQLRRMKMPRYYTALGTVRLQSDGSVWFAEQLNE